MSTARHLAPVVAVVAFAGLSAVRASAQMAGPHGHFRGPPAFLEQVFPPELVMRHQDEIGLTSEQRDAISRAMSDTQKTLVDLQWQFERESKRLGDALAADTIDEPAALAQADRVMALEVQMKKAHLGLLIRIKNVLTPAQREKLRALRRRSPGGRPRGGEG